MANKEKHKNHTEKTLHGNGARIDPKAHVESLYQSNRVTQSGKKDHETPIVNDEDVAYAKSFVDENKK